MEKETKTINNNTKHYVSHEVLLGVLNERTENLTKEIGEVKKRQIEQGNEIKSLIEASRNESNDKFDSLSKKLEEHYVSKTEFKPVKAIVFGMIAIIVITVLAALLSTVII